MAAKYHIGKNGPAICNARVRACRYGDQFHGTENEVNALWEQQQNEKFGFSVISKKEKINERIPQQTRDTLSDRKNYSAPTPYEETEKDMAMKIALSEMTEFSYLPVKGEDEYFWSSGCTSTKRIELTDGSIGYFKSFNDNADVDETVFEDFGTSSLGATINEVNAYRISREMGKGFDHLVPETVIREVNGKIGSFQRESVEINKKRISLNHDKEYAEDYRKAAIFDFVIGNLDRHSGNYINSKDKTDPRKPRLSLIDNSFSFPKERFDGFTNQSQFTSDAEYFFKDKEFSKTEIESLNKAKTAIEKWKKNRTINESRAQAAIDRINHPLKTKKFEDFVYYQDKKRRE